MIQATVKTKINQFKLDLDLNISGRGITGLMGRSGSGKSSFLKWFAGFIPNATAYLSVNGEVWEDSELKYFKAPHFRSVGYIFQDSGLLPFISVKNNLLYGLRRVPTDCQSNINMDTAIEMLGISKLLNQFPAELSGGEKQRVAIARSLIIGAKVFLFDEPMASLDEDSKQEIFPYLLRLKNEIKTPMIYVTHSTSEANVLCDQILKIHQGQIVSNNEYKEKYISI